MIWSKTFHQRRKKSANQNTIAERTTFVLKCYVSGDRNMLPTAHT